MDYSTLGAMYNILVPYYWKIGDYHPKCTTAIAEACWTMGSQTAKFVKLTTITALLRHGKQQGLQLQQDVSRNESAPPDKLLTASKITAWDHGMQANPGKHGCLRLRYPKLCLYSVRGLFCTSKSGCKGL